MQMKHAVVTEHGSPEVIELQETEVPPVGPNDVKVDVKTNSLMQTAVEQRRGRYKGSIFDWADNPPFTTGLSLTGDVVEVGDKVEQWDVGDRIVTSSLGQSGCMSDYFVFNTEHQWNFFDTDHGPEHFSAFEIPDDIGYKTSQVISSNYSSYPVFHGLGEVSDGDNVLIYSVAGGLGCFMTQMADVMDDVTVFGTSSSYEKLDKVKNIGLDHGINYEEEDVVERVQEITGEEKPIDVFVDTVGGSMFKDGISLLRRYGKCVVLGVASGRPGMANTADILYTPYELRGFHITAACMSREYQPVVKRGHEFMYELYRDGDLDPMMGEVFQMEDIVQAHQYMEEKKNIGRPIVDVGL